MELTFLGATREVTGSCSYLNVAGKKLLIDYGMEQGKDFFENRPIPVNPGELDAVLVTHAHIDHTGMLPLLRKNGFAGEVHATKGTCSLCEIMLRDSAHIQEFEADWRNRKAKRTGAESYTPLYTTEDADSLISRLRAHPYNQRFQLFPGIDVRFVDAGHLLGSSSIELWLSENGVEKKLVFSGDLGNIRQPLLNDASLIDAADYVVMESTYADRVHDMPPDYAKELASVLQRTFDRGGSVIIPSFAVGRTQEMLYFLRHIKSEGLVHGHDGFPVFVDSPLANAATRVFLDNADSCFDQEARAFIDQGLNPIAFPGLTLTETSQESIAINSNTSSKVILSASGMCEAGRIKHHLKHHLWKAADTVLFVGYQAEGTLGRLLLQGAKKVKLFNEDVSVNAEICQLPGVSSHGDSKFLLQWITHYAPRPAAVFVNHGDADVAGAFAERLQREYGLAAEAPYSGWRFDLAQGVWLDQPAAVSIGKKDGAAAQQKDSPYRRLLAALERLTKLIQSGTGRSNRELKSVTRQLDSICDEWEND